ncbi:MAG: selenide, water dikinase SelD [Alphaproteobacteria bacterium]
MENKVSLTKHTKFSGCGAKLGPNVLQKALCGLSQPIYPNVVANYDGCEDAGLYAITPEKLLVQTVDFFPPIVDDPFMFGRIAAANALSDVYAMGGRPITALALVCYPVKELGLETLRAMMDGGLSALTEAGCALVGGHSIEDSEPKLGYAVTGETATDKFWRNNGLKDNCKIILTKSIGTGLINMAFRGDCVSDEALAASQKSMTTLNKTACEILQKYQTKACTDVTGFGLLGHMAEMVTDAACGIKVKADAVPLLPDVLEYSSMGLVPEGTFRNRQGRGHAVKDLDKMDPVIRDILFDPQTSGGLLAAVKEEDAEKIIAEMAGQNIYARIIGETTRDAGVITIA